MCGRMYEIKNKTAKTNCFDNLIFEYVSIEKEIPRQAFLPISVSLLPLLMLRFDVFLKILPYQHVATDKSGFLQ